MSTAAHAAHPKGFYYLASPYSARSKRLMHERYLQALDCKAWLLVKGIWVYSPIVHCHETARLHDMPTDAAFWQDYNHVMIDASVGLLVVNVNGVADSKGVQEELEYSRLQRKPIGYVNPSGISWAIVWENGGHG